MSSSKQLRLAVIGFGPRALGALEALATQSIKRKDIVQIDIYDPFRWPGTGPNYDPEQSNLCILNIPVRVVDYEPPEFMSSRIQPFLEWSAGRYQRDDFPPRSDIGAYLNERFEALKQAAGDTLAIAHSNVKITGLEQQSNGWWVTSEGKRHGPYDEVLLTQGQPETSPDPQLERWIKHAAENELDLLSAYPANTLIAAAEDWRDKTVAIRGLGLSTLDVIRMLTTGLGGKFNDGRYNPSGREPRKLIPFSLNGQPPAAKPATNTLDKKFDPTDEETDLFVSALSATVSSQPEAALRLICGALIKPTVRILSEFDSPETEEDVRNWLEIERSDPGSQEVRDAIDILKSDIEMAHGRTPPSVGYVTGQVWRKLQDELRSCFNQNQHEADTANAIIGLDEGLKRFSYGPPVFAAEELLKLINSGIVSLCTVDDPAIILSGNGWQLIEGDDLMTASAMVDAVLPSPSLDSTADPLLLDCVAAGFIKPIAEGLGAHISPDGQLIGSTCEAVPGLCMLGRLTLGSVIAVDGLDDCFGPSTTRWADGVVERMSQRA